jgi:hypothetical protein
VVLIAATAGAGCARKPPEPPPAPPRIIHEQPLRPTPTTIDIQVGPPTWTDTADGRDTWVEGSVRNRGSRPTREITIWVTGLDAGGNVVSRADGSPMQQLVVPGASTRYRVRVANDPSIKTFHVEALGR